MAFTTPTMKQVSLKLMVNEKTNKVLFAEATKDFVDCSFLTLPLGTLARLLRKKSNIGPITIGCLDTLYQNVENPYQKFLHPVPCEEMLLNPKNSCYCSALELNIEGTEPKKYFICENFGGCQHRLLYTSSDSICFCGHDMSQSVFLNDFPEGFVNGGVITYYITDDLVVMPNSLGTSLGFLQKFGVKSISSIKEVMVNVTSEKMLLDLLKCSLLSKTSLTDLFLRKKPFLEFQIFSPCHAENSTHFEIKVKLAIRKSNGKILYAQGEEDFADLLLCFLTFPLGGVARMLGGNCSLGSIDGLYRSIADLDEKYFTSKEVKHRLVDPRLAPNRRLRNKILPIHESNDLGYYVHYMKTYGVYEFHNFIITDYRGGAADGGNFLKMDFDFENDPLTGSGGVGFVDGPTMYLATDDLIITPISPVSTIHLLRDSKTNLSDLKEKEVTIGIKECLSILKASLSSAFALTNGLSHLLTELEEGNC